MTQNQKIDRILALQNEQLENQKTLQKENKELHDKVDCIDGKVVMLKRVTFGQTIETNGDKIEVAEGIYQLMMKAKPFINGLYWVTRWKNIAKIGGISTIISGVFYVIKELIN